MTHDTKLAQLGAAVGSAAGRQMTRRESAALASAHKHALASELTYAEAIWLQLREGWLAPHPGGDQRVRAMFKAIRYLESTGQPKLITRAKDLRLHLRNNWGLREAAGLVARGRDHHLELREEWGDAQLPPEGALVGLDSADEALIRALVARLPR